MVAAFDVPCFLCTSTAYAVGVVGAIGCIVVFISTVSALLFAFAVFCQMAELVALVALCNIEFGCVHLWVVVASFDGHALGYAGVRFFHTTYV